MPTKSQVHGCEDQQPWDKPIEATNSPITQTRTLRPGEAKMPNPTASLSPVLQKRDTVSKSPLHKGEGSEQVTSQEVQLLCK